MKQRTLFTSDVTAHEAARYLDDLVGDDLGLNEIVVSIAAFQLVESTNGRYDLIMVVNTRVLTAETTPPLF